jgi:hypothetical protein
MVTMKTRRTITALTIAAGILAGSTGTASAYAGDVDMHPESTVGQDCVYQEQSNPHEYCLPQYAPDHQITSGMNPVERILDNIASLWPF